MHTIIRIQAVRVRAWVTTLTSILRPRPRAVERGGGALVWPVHYLPLLDQIGELPAVACRRLRGEDDFHFKHRLALHLQEEVLAREQFEELLDQVLALRS